MSNFVKVMLVFVTVASIVWFMFTFYPPFAAAITVFMMCLLGLLGYLFVRWRQAKSRYERLRAELAHFDKLVSEIKQIMADALVMQEPGEFNRALNRLKALGPERKKCGRDGAKIVQDYNTLTQDILRAQMRRKGFLL